MNVRRTALAAAVFAAVSGTIAWSAGNWSTMPIIGQGSFCGTTVTGTGNLGGVTGQGQGTTGSICAQTIPAGPTGLTGQETIPLDLYGVNPTATQSGQPLQSARVPVGLMAPGSIFQGAYAMPKNLLRNGDLSVNPWQHGTSQAADISNTVTTSADGFRMVGGASSAINWSQQTGASDIVASQFTKSLRFQRKSGNTDTAAVCQIFVLTSAESIPLQGQSFVYSFWAKPGANFSPTNGNVSVSVAWGTGTDDTSANFKTGSWTGFTNAVTAGNSSSSSFPVSVASGVATASTLPSGSTAAWTQYWVSGTIGSTATQVGTEICFTPIGTAGANDWIETANHQLEIVGAGVLTPSAFEHQHPQDAVDKATRMFWRLAEPASGAAVNGFCQATGANTNTCTVMLPNSMRAATPTIAITTAGTFNVNIAGTPTAFATPTAGVCSSMACTVTGANTNTAGQAEQLTGGGGSGKWDVTAEL